MIHENCKHFNKCKLMPISEVTPNGYNIILDEQYMSLCHVMQVTVSVKEAFSKGSNKVFIAKTGVDGIYFEEESNK